MTIQKRLFISNILMLCIPAALAVIMLAGGLAVFLFTAFPHAEYELGFPGELLEMRHEVESLALKWLRADAARQEELEGKLEELAAESRLTLEIGKGQQVVLQIGPGPTGGQSQLEQSLAALHGNGTVSDGSYDLYGKQTEIEGELCQIRLYNPVVTISGQQRKAWAAGIGLFLVALLLGVVFLTNRFLTKFVFRKIAEPLQTLAEGVRQIRDGNLTHRIDYNGQDEFEPVCEDFNEMAQRLRASVERTQKEEESRKELLASISHDIRSPLTSIRAYVEGLLDGVADTKEKQGTYLSTIQKKTMEIDQMVRKLFLFSKMELGEYPYAPERQNAVAEIADFVAASREEYGQRGLEITLGLMPDQAWIEADPTYFRSILTNLLDNSAKYKDKERGKVCISGQISGRELRLYVDDDGPGVPEEALPKLFDVFYRNDPSRKNPNQGSGLGLAIVSKTVERMGGTIHGENLPGGGLRMALGVPLAQGGQRDETHFDH